LNTNVNSSPITILLVDDNPGDARLIQEMLAESSRNSQFMPVLQLIHSDRLTTGLARLAANDIDILLLDLSLPDSHGLETFHRAQAQGADIPIIVLTSLNDEMLAIKAVQSGAQDYLVKGQMDGNLLVRSIRYAIERHQSQLKLQSSEVFLRTIINHHADGIMLVGQDGVIKFVNPAAEALFGRKAPELLGQPFGFPVVTDSRTELDIINKEKGSIIVEMRAANMNWQSQPVFLASLRDVTNSKRVEEALRQSESLKSAILESALDCIITINHENEIIEFNPAAAETFSYARAEAVGKNITDLIYSVSTGEVYGQSLVSHLMTNQGAGFGKRIEGLARRADGSAFPVELAITPLHLENRPVFTAYVRDITERKRIEKASQELIQMKDEFVANISHQLRTPLFSVKGFLDLLIRE